MKKHPLLLLALLAVAGTLLCLPVILTAAPAAPAAAALHPSLAEAIAPWYASDTFWAAALAIVSGIVAILRNKTATTAQKINAALILGIEQATQLPEVAAAETKVKNLIRSKAQQAGVEPILNRLVKDLTL